MTVAFPLVDHVIMTQRAPASYSPRGQFLMTSVVLFSFSRPTFKELRRPHGPNLDLGTPNINLHNQSIFEIAHRFGVAEVPKAVRESVKPVSSKMPGSPPLPKDVERLDIRAALSAYLCMKL